MKKSETREVYERTLCLLPDPTVQRLFAAAVVEMRRHRWGNLRLERISDWPSLLAQLQEAPAELLLVDPCVGAEAGDRSESENKVIRRVADLLDQVPAGAVIVCPCLRELEAPELLGLGRLGITNLLDPATLATPYVLALRLRRVSGLARGYHAIGSLADAVPRWCLSLLKRALPHAHRKPESRWGGERGLSASKLADLWILGANRQLLARRLGEAGLPSPGWISRWLVVLRAVLLLESRRNLETVALELGFSSRGNLRAFGQRLLGQSPRSADIDQVTSAFREQVEQGRN